jgi:proteasome assembly chaperone (PAC2) family protein
MKGIKLHRRPELVDPHLIAAWPGVGNVAMIAATYLKDRLGAKELGEIDPAGFFDLGGVFIRDNIVDPPEFPESRFYYSRGRDGGRDVIIFIGQAQPAAASYEYAGLVLDVAERFGVKRAYSLAAALTEYHPDRPRVLGAASSPELLEALRQLDVVMAGDFYVAGMNGLLVGVAASRGIEGVCLLGETVKYAAKMANPRSALAVLEVLTRLLGCEIDMSELEGHAVTAEKQIRELGNEMKREFLQNFTKPIWERQEEEENG